ncbi:hypothetical protein Droror1_Dr00011293 [Drosera rotundifolia]
MGQILSSCKQVLSSAAQQLINTLTFRPNGTIDRRLFNFLHPRVPATPTALLDGVESHDIIVDPSRDLWFRLFVPVRTATTKSLPVLVYFHGGGFAVGSPDTKLFDIFARKLARDLPAVVISVNYRLAPENKFPAQFEDGFHVLEYIDRNVNSADWVPHAADPMRCFLAGDSAGGNLAHHVAVQSCKTKLKEITISGVISIQPFFGGMDRTESEIRLRSNPVLTPEAADWCWRAFLPVGSDRDHPAVNVFGPRATEGYLSALDYPPTMLVIGGLDPLQDWQRRFRDGLARAGKAVRLVEYPDMMHGFYVMDPSLAEIEMLVREAREFIAQYT